MISKEVPIQKIESFCSQGNKIIEYRNTDNILHNPCDAAKIIYFMGSEQIKREEYRDEGLLHNKKGPAYITYFKNGMIKRETYVIAGKKHRDDGPAHILYNTNGTIKEKKYFLNNEDKTEEIKKWAHFKNYSEDENLLDLDEDMSLIRKLELGF